MQSILLLEDDDDLRDIIADVLRDADYEVLPVGGAAEALEAARKQSFHLILSDVRMEGALDGVAVIEQVKGLQRHIRSIVMTGYADQEVPLRAARIRADDYLHKPFELDSLLTMVGSVIAQDRPFRGLFSRLVDASAEAAHRARRWIFDAHLTRLNQVRDGCLRRFYLVIRSGRRSAQEMYIRFCQLERLELEYLRCNQRQGWVQLTAAYECLEESLLGEVEAAEQSETLSWPLAAQLYQKIQSGRIEPGHLQQAILLLHDPEARKRSLEAYCTYHWLWSSERHQSDPLLGRTIQGYVLERRRSSDSARGRLYDARPEAEKEIGDVVLALPADQESAEIARQEVQSGLCSLLLESEGHYFLLYPGESRSLARRIPPQGLAPAEAWALLRPVFQLVYSYHQKGRCCGHFGLPDIELLPQQPPRIRRFDDATFRRRAAEIRAGRLLACTQAAPEVDGQAHPTPRSDQFCLGLALFWSVLGQAGHDFPQIYLLSLGSPGVETLWQEVSPGLGPLAPHVYRLCQADPARRFPDLRQAAMAIDQALAP